MLKKIIGKLERKMIMTWILMWLNVSTVTLNAMLKVEESINVKKSEYNLIYLNLNKILYV